MLSTGSEREAQRVSATGGSARSQADELDERRWRPRRYVSVLVRLVSFAVPLVAAIAAVHEVGMLVPRPGSSFALAGWVVLLAVLATVTVRIVDHLGRRLLPLEALLKLSLVFPDRAPSRFALALRSGSGRALERAVATARSVEGYPAPQEAAELVVALIASLSRHDRLTRGHSERVRAYADLIGQQLRLDEDSAVKLHWAALVHDVGKLDVPAEILTKKGRPTKEEWLVLQQHPGSSQRYLRGLEAWLGEWGRAATEHHERIDGDGYPAGLRGDEISLAGRIVAVADAFDVMTSARSYKKPHPAARARAELTENAGTQFDPEIVRAFLSVSLRDLRLVMGPLACLMQLPALAQVPLEAAAAAFAPVVAALAATALALAAPAHAVSRGVPGGAARFAAAVAASTGGAGSQPTVNAPSSGPGTKAPRGSRHTAGGGGANGPTGRSGGTGQSGGGPGSTSPAATTTAPASPSTTAPPSPATTAPPDDHPPVAVNDTPKGKLRTQTVTVDVLANDYDPDGDLAPATLSIVRYPPSGKYQSISIVGDKVQFTAPVAYKGSTTFRYQICDTHGACAQAEVTLTFQL